MDERSRIADIRRSEEQSHTKMYTENALFAEGSWLAKPVKTVISLLSHFETAKSMRVLDIGCGVGRNCIPIAKSFNDIPCVVDCVDILPFAIEKLKENALLHQCEHAINGIVSTIEEYHIEQNTYDLIIAVSAMEHICSYDAFCSKIKEIQKGLKPNGLFCLVMSTDIFETTTDTYEKLPIGFELNLSSNELGNALFSYFTKEDCILLANSLQEYIVPRDDKQVRLSSNVYTYVFMKN